MKYIKYLFIFFCVQAFGQSVDGTYKTVTAGGTANTYTISDATFGGYVLNEKWIVDFGTTTLVNSGASTINRNSYGAKYIKNPDGSDVTSGTLKGRVPLSYNGVYFQVTGGAGASISATSPLVYSAGTLSIPAANGSTNGYLASGDWTTFNNKQSALTFSTGLTNTAGTITVNTSQNISTLSNLTTNGFVKTSGGTGALSVSTSISPTTDISGWPANASGVLTNNGSGTLTWGASGGSATSTPTASTTSQWDANVNFSANNFIAAFNTSATAGGTTTLTVTSPKLQYRTGSANETIVMPVTSTLVRGFSFEINNVNNTGSLTINSSGGNTIITMPAGSLARIKCILTSGTTAASWDYEFLQPFPLTSVGDLLIGGTVVSGIATPTRLASGASNTALIGNGIGSAPSYQVINTHMIYGDQTSTAATAGYLGENSSSAVAVGSATSLTTATAKNVTSLVLPPGHWIVYGIANFTESSATVTARSWSLSTTSATLATDGGESNNDNATTTTTQKIGGNCMPFISESSSSVTIYLVVKSTFSAGTVSAYGKIIPVRFQ